MKKLAIAAITLFVFVIGTMPLAGQGITLKKDITVEADEIQENVMSFGGSIIVKGKVKKNVIAFGGSILIEGEVGDTVLSFGSSIDIKSSARISGDVVSLGGIMHKEPGASIGGDFIHFETTEDLNKFFKATISGLLGMAMLPVFFIFKLISLFIWFLFAVITATVFPRQIKRAASQIRQSFWPVFGTGLLGLFVFIILLLFSVLLSLILIGIPLLIALLIIGFLAKIFGRVAFFYFFGDMIARSMRNKDLGFLPMVIIGFFLVSVIDFIPLLGPFVSFILNILGWGLVIRTKFGTTENWLQKKRAADTA